MYLMKTKVLIKCAVTVQLICAFVFAYAKSRFSNDVAKTRQLSTMLLIRLQMLKLILIFAACICIYRFSTDMAKKQ